MNAPNSATNAAQPSSSLYAVTVSTRLSRAAMSGFAILIVALVFAPLVLARSQTQDLILILLLIGLAQCWNLLAGYAGLISVGQQAFVGLGAYTLYYCVNILGLDPLISVVLAAVFVALLSIPIGLVVFRLQGAYFAVVTWVVAEIFRLCSALWPTLGGGAGTSLQSPANMFGVSIVAELFEVRNAAAREIVIYWAALIVTIGITLGAYLILRSRFGLALTAIKDGEVAAESIGIDITRTKFIVHVVAALGAALVGALYFLQQGSITPAAAFSLMDWTAYVIFIVIIGGLGTIEGPIIGAIVFVLLRSLLASFGPWYLIFLGLLAILIMLFAPKGIWGAIQDRYNISLFPTRRRLCRTELR